RRDPAPGGGDAAHLPLARDPPRGPGGPPRLPARGGDGAGHLDGDRGDRRLSQRGARQSGPAFSPGSQRSWRGGGRPGAVRRSDPTPLVEGLDLVKVVLAGPHPPGAPASTTCSPFSSIFPHRMTQIDGLVHKLRELAQNLWWSWQPEIRFLFRELD